MRKTGQYARKMPWLPPVHLYKIVRTDLLSTITFVEVCTLCRPLPVATVGLWWAEPPETKLQAPRNWNTINQRSSCQFLECQAPRANANPPPHNSKAPLLRTFWGWFCCRHVTTTSTFCQNYFVLIGKLTASHKQYRAVSFVASKVHKRTPMYN